jgi:hypothetical protein
MSQQSSDLVEHFPFPYVDPTLVARLDSVFPNRCARLGEPPEMIWYQSGQASVVEFLKSIVKDQQET